MKGSLKLRPRRALNRAEAWACFGANLALAGSGSLAAGRPVGYWQMAAVFLAMILTIVTSIPFFRWLAAGGAASVVQPPLDDPMKGMSELWPYLRWPLASIGLYAASILWAIATSLDILAKTPKEGVPPRIR